MNSLLSLYRDILCRILEGEDHRGLVHRYIAISFVEQCVSFFKSVVDAKLNSTDITADWYRENFINDPSLSKQDLAVNAGTNLKSIDNKRGTTKREIVLEESLDSYDNFLVVLDDLIDEQVDIDLAVSLNGVTAHLTLNESVIVINALAVRRAAIRGGAWSRLGKNIETPLMLCLCKIFDVKDENYSVKNKIPGGLREVDFYLITGEGERVNCEIKLQGKGNPEGADAVFARNSRVFIGSKLSDTNKTQLHDHGILWVELQAHNGFMRFGEILEQLGIPHKDVNPNESLESYIDDVLSEFGLTECEGD